MIGERENEVAVRRMWERFEAREWYEARAAFSHDLVVYWSHTRETFRGGMTFVEMNRAFPDWDHIQNDRVVGKGRLVVSEITVTAGDRIFRAAAFFEMLRVKIARAIEYWIGEGMETPPSWRAPFATRGRSDKGGT